ncbi:hypothetical protein LQW54_005941 [Pestalotiopsis sp. IQ-011]
MAARNTPEHSGRRPGEATLPGWPSIASKQSRLLNMGISRHFALLKSRVMVDLQTKLSSMEKTIQKLDQDDAQNDPERLKKLPFDPKHLFHACYDTWMKYSSLISMSQRMDENPKASSFSYENFRNFVRSDLPDGEAWDALVGEENDFIRIRTSPLDKELEWLRWLLDDKPRLGFGKLFMKFFRHGNDFHDEHKYIRQSFETFLTRIAGTGVGLFCMVIVAVPVGILLLVPLSDLYSFILVVVCSLVVLLVVIVRIPNFATAFVAFSTYMAILVTSLSNLYQARTH